MRRAINTALLPTLVALVLMSTPTHAGQWQVQHEQSRFGFIATYEDVGFETRFERYDADIRFDPEDLAASRFEVTIDMASVNSDSVDRDEGMLGEEWFDTARYPQARFTATEFTAVADGYQAVGDLTIKGTTRRIVLPFSWQSSSAGARLQAEITVARTDFRIGTGEWQKDGTIGFEVRIVVDLSLVR